jgi:hypothetical protein
MAQRPKSVQDRPANPQAVSLKNGSNCGGGSASTPQRLQTTTGCGIRGGSISKPIKTDKGC